MKQDDVHRRQQRSSAGKQRGVFMSADTFVKYPFPFKVASCVTSVI